MNINELRNLIQAAGGRENALAYAEPLLTKINRVSAHAQYGWLIDEFRSAREEGDFRGRVFEVNFLDCFIRAGIVLEYAVKQGMRGDVDFLWRCGQHNVFIELKLIGQDRATRDDINRQLADTGMSATLLLDDTRDIARLQFDLMQKSSVRKFNPKPDSASVNLVGVDVTELQLGMADICDCLLAAGGNTLARQHCHPAELRERVVGVFEAPENLTDAQKDWFSHVQKIIPDAPHPRTYMHGALFFFRSPPERAALSYDLRAMVVWNPTLMKNEVATKLASAFDQIIPLGAGKSKTTADGARLRSSPARPKPLLRGSRPPASSLDIIKRVMRQRDVMRELFRRFGGDRTRVVEAYAEAERRGEVKRKSDSHDTSADEYASRLFADGVRKGWIQD